MFGFFFSSRRRHTRSKRDWSSDVCSSDLDAILRALDRLGLHWDGEVLYQSRRLEHYRAALDKLAPQTYWCGCTRREIADSSLGLAADGAHIYPGTCRRGGPGGRAVRVRTTMEPIAFV